LTISSKKITKPVLAKEDAAMVLGAGAILSKASCPKCGSRNVSKITTRLPLRKNGLQKTGKQYPEPYNDEPPEHYMPPIMDFNHTHRCNSCGHFFGSSWGGVL
jgi:predicted RNA-binding Zn-ribbon protein involved in translation (DUF1610 family)